MEANNDKSKRKSWNRQNMIDAVNAIIDGKMGYLKTSKLYKVPKITLHTLRMTNLIQRCQFIHH